jgi:hypothetical protein
MKRQDAYTIIETMIVLSISTILFISAAGLFHSDRKNVEFSQAATELESKIRFWVNSVSTGAFLENLKYSCSVSTGRPVLSLAGPGGQSCIYVGKMIEAVPTTSDIYSYEILGRRLDSNGDPVTDLSSTNPITSANPEPAGVSGGIGFKTFAYQDFAEKYTVPNGAKVLSAKIGPQENDILKAYTNLQATSTTSRQLTMYASQFAADINSTPTGSSVGQSSVIDCAEELTSCTGHNNISTTGWQVCIQSADGSKTAVINVLPAVTGVTTRIDFVTCS